MRAKKWPCCHAGAVALPPCRIYYILCVGSTDVDEVWAKYVAGDSGFKLEGGFLWELPDGLRTVVTDRSKVYVRDVYVKWIDMLFNLHKMDKRGLMIRGTPGIGMHTTWSCCSCKSC